MVWWAGLLTPLAYPHAHHPLPSHPPQTTYPPPPCCSFSDIVKRLAGTPEGDACFVSKRPEAVERFVVAHGQIILNQFQNYPGA